MVPLAAAAMALTSVKPRVVEGFIEPRLQVTWPLDPTAGGVQEAPGGATSETKVVCEGMGSTTVVPVATVTPELFTVYWVVRLLPLLANWGACAAMERPGRNAPKASTYTSPQ